MSEQKRQVTPGTEHEHDIEIWGEDFLMRGVIKCLERGHALAGRDFDAESAQGKVKAEAWYEAMVGKVPCKYWKEITNRAAQIAPYDRFTFGQFMQAWGDLVKSGHAQGHLKV